MSELEQSILKSTKKILGLASDYDAFDLDITTHVNAALSTLSQLGVGPDGGLSIEDATTEWVALEENNEQTNLAKTFVFLKVRMLFDPPLTSFAIEAAEKQLEQYEWRISVNRESDDWADPDPPSVEDESLL